MDHNAGAVEAVMRVAGDMIALVDDDDRVAVCARRSAMTQPAGPAPTMRTSQRSRRPRRRTAGAAAAWRRLFRSAISVAMLRCVESQECFLMWSSTAGSHREGSRLSRSASRQASMKSAPLSAICTACRGAVIAPRRRRSASRPRFCLQRGTRASWSG